MHKDSLKEKNGFTLVELLAVIVILAIVITIAVSSFGKITNRMKQKSRENLISYIETKAEAYSNETGNLRTNVDHLVKEGYLDPDDEAGHIIDPINGEYLNCYIVDIVNENNNYYGRFIDDENQQKCNVNDIEILNKYATIKAYKSENGKKEEKEISENTWVNTDVYLELILGEELLPKKEKITEIVWIGGGEQSVAINGNFNTTNNHLIVEAKNVINIEYKARIEFNDGTREFSNPKRVKIDKQRPFISNFSVSDGDNFSKEKQITLDASDGEGSGISAYRISNESDCLNEKNYHYTSVEVIRDLKITETITNNGDYYACVKDAAGNVSEDKSTKLIKVNKIDNTPPTCVLKVNGMEGPDDWYISNVEIIFDATDANGIDKKILDGQTLFPDSLTITEDCKDRKVEAWAFDKAGNYCHKSVTIKRDATPPTCTLKVTKPNSLPSGKSYYTSDVTIGLVTKSDNLSGIKNYAITDSNSVPKSYNLKDSIDFSTNNGTKTFYGHIIDNAGNTNRCELSVKIQKEINPTESEDAPTKGTICTEEYEPCCPSGVTNCNCNLSNPSDCTPNTMCCPPGKDVDSFSCPSGQYLIGEKCYTCPEGTHFDNEKCKY